MKWFIIYLLFQVCVFLIFWIVSKRKDKRYKSSRACAPPGFEPTNEVSIDPVSHVVTRVYIHPETGERLYIEENPEKKTSD